MNTFDTLLSGNAKIRLTYRVQTSDTFGDHSSAVMADFYSFMFSTPTGIMGDPVERFTPGMWQIIEAKSTG